MYKTLLLYEKIVERSEKTSLNPFDNPTSKPIIFLTYFIDPKYAYKCFFSYKKKHTESAEIIFFGEILITHEI